MATSIDERIVGLRFDNKDFEKNIKTSLDSLDNLDKRLKNAVSSNGLKNIGEQASKINISSLINNVETLTNRFSTFGIVGMTALQHVTEAAINAAKSISSIVVGPITSGGWSRAMNIEQAKFQLKGLLGDAEAVAKVMEDVDYGVSGTAYSLDAAAKVASSLVASGLTAGKVMKDTLRGISGVAAMTNSSYEDIGSIFTAVAGQGKVMTMQLRQLEFRGMNAAAVITNFVNKVGRGEVEASESIKKVVNNITGGMVTTEASIRDLVTKGKINFDLFSSAMDEAFGEHAKAANDTFTGSLANIRSALARIGEIFARPTIQNAIPVFNAIREKVNEIKASLVPAGKEFEKFAYMVSEKLVNIIKGNGISAGISTVLSTMKNLFFDLLLVVMPIKEALKDIFPKNFGSSVLNFLNNIKNLSSQLIISREAADNLKRTFRGFFAIIDIGITAFGSLLKVLSPTANKLIDTGSGFLSIAASLGDYIVNLRDSIKETGLFMNVLKPFGDLLNIIFGGFKKLISFITTSAIPKLEEGARSIKESLTNVFTNLSLENLIKNALTVGIGGALTEGIFGILINFKHLKNEALSIVSVIKKLPINLNTYLRDLQDGLKADVIKSVAISIGILSASLIALSMVKPEKLAMGLLALTTVLTEFSIAIGVLLKMFSGPLPIPSGVNGFLNSILGTFSTYYRVMSMGNIIIKFAVAIAILSGSLALLSILDTKRLMAGVMAISILMAELLAASKYMSGLDKLKDKGPTALMSFASSLFIMASAIKMLGNLKPDQLMNGLQTITILLLELSTASAFLSQYSGKAKVSGLALIGMATSILIFAAAMKVLSTIPDIGQPGMAVLGFILGFVGVMQNMPSFEKILSTGAALLAFSSSLLIFSAAMKVLGSISAEGLILGLFSIAMMLIMFNKAAMAMIGQIKNYYALAGALILFSGALLLFAPAMAALSMIGLEGTVIALIAISGAITILAISAKLFAKVIPQMLAMTSVLAAFSVALLLFAPAMAVLSSVKFEGVVAGLIGLGAAISIFAIAANLLVGFIPAMLGIAGVVAAVSGGILALALALRVLSSSADILKEKLPTAVTAIVEAIDALLWAIGNNIGSIIDAGIQIVVGLLEGIAIKLPDLINVAFELIIQFVDGLALAIDKNAGKLISAAEHLINSLLKALLSAGFMLLNVGSEWIGMILKGLVTWAGELFKAGFELVFKLLEVLGVDAEWIDIARKWIRGIIDGIVEFTKNAIDAVTTFAQSLIGKLKEIFGIGNNGGAYKIGKEFDEEVATGIKDNGDKIEAAAEEVTGSIDTLSDKMEDATDSTDVLSKASDKVSDKITDLSSTVLDSDKAFSEYADTLGIDIPEGYDAATVFAERYGDVLGETTRAEVEANETREASYRKMIFGKAKAQKQLEDLLGKEGYVQYIERMARAEQELEDRIGPTEYALLKQAEAARELEEAATSLCPALERVGWSADEIAGAYQSVHDAIANQMDIFSKFEVGTVTGTSTMLNNMQSQVDGVQNWADNLTTLGQAGIEQGLLQELALLGPEGAAHVQTFVNMSTDQLEKANELWLQAAELKESATAQVLESYANAAKENMKTYTDNLVPEEGAVEEAAKNVADAVVDGVDTQIDARSGDIQDAGDTIGDRLLEGAKNILEIASPSGAFMRIADNCIEGLSNGLILGSNEILYPLSYEICEQVLRIFTEELAMEKFIPIGFGIVLGLCRGINDGKPMVINEINIMAAQIIETARIALDQSHFIPIGYQIVDGIAIGIRSNMSAIIAIQELAAALQGAIASVLAIHSPSRVMAQYGEYISEGIALGIYKGGHLTEEAMYNVSESVIDGMQNTIDMILSAFNNDADLQPVITPVLDLSYVNAGAQHINGLFTNKTLSLYDELLEKENSKKSTQVNFTQNNYSPKALSSIEIYRQTRNQLSTMKRTIGRFSYG